MHYTVGHGPEVSHGCVRTVEGGNRKMRKLVVIGRL